MCLLYRNCAANYVASVYFSPNHCYYVIDAQSCVDTVNVQQRGTDRLSWWLYVIVPQSNFSCNGRITGYMASLNQDRSNNCFNPRIIVWQPVNTQRTMHSIRNISTLSSEDIITMENYYFANVSFTGNDRIEFQSGDVIGYQHRFRPCYTVWSINTGGYTSYGDRFISSNTINIDDDSSVTATADRQPLIQVIFGMTYNMFTIYGF